MAKILTQGAIDSLKHSNDRQEIADGKVPGLRLILQPLPSTRRSWQLRYSMAGVSKRYTIGNADAISIKDARRLALEAIAKVGQGVDPGAELKAAKAAAVAKKVETKAAEGRAFETVLRRYITTHAAAINPKTGKPRLKTHRELHMLLEREFVADFKTRKPVWRGRDIKAITKADVRARVAEIMARGSPISACRALQCVRAFFGWALSEDIVDANPTLGVKKPVDEEPRSRVLLDDELLRLWRASDALPAPYATMLKLYVLTGARKREITTLEWDDVDLAARRVNLPAERVKNKRAHTIFLCDLSAELLSETPRIEGSPYVFGPRPPMGWDHHVRALRKAVAFDQEWSLHDIRRSFVTGLARIGVDLHVIELAVNHISGSFGGIRAVYQHHQYEPQVRSAFERWGQHVQALLDGKQKSNVVAFKG